jgi:hypothetical protein
MFWQYIKCHSRIWHRIATWAVPKVLPVHQVPLQDMALCCHMSSAQSSASTSSATLGYGTVLPQEQFPMFSQYIRVLSPNTTLPYPRPECSETALSQPQISYFCYIISFSLPWFHSHFSLPFNSGGHFQSLKLHCKVSLRSQKQKPNKIHTVLNINTIELTNVCQKEICHMSHRHWEPVNPICCPPEQQKVEHGQWLYTSWDISPF